MTQFLLIWNHAFNLNLDFLLYVKYWGHNLQYVLIMVAEKLLAKYLKWKITVWSCLSNVWITNILITWMNIILKNGLYYTLRFHYIVNNLQFQIIIYTSEHECHDVSFLTINAFQIKSSQTKENNHTFRRLMNQNISFSPVFFFVYFSMYIEIQHLVSTQKWLKIKSNTAVFVCHSTHCM